MLYSWNSFSPILGAKTFVAPSADIIGNVQIGKYSSIWFHVTIRGDVFPIIIGDYTNIQDNVVIHVTRDMYATHIGNYVTIGHSSVIHGATLKDHAYVGMSATILDEAVIEPYGFVAAGAVVPPRKRVESYTLVAGVPAKEIRKITKKEIDMIERSPKEYVQLAQQYIDNLEPLT